ncbi:MAG: DUF2807 domain-containing protein [Chloroflexaceae bacterium]|nr:DUF2807 domain-containing protein [Chloroflexaceae bacterium]
MKRRIPNPGEYFSTERRSGALRWLIARHSSLVTGMMLLVALVLTGCQIGGISGGAGEAIEVITGTGNIVTETREVSGFDVVYLQGKGHLIITQGERETLTVETDENLMPLIETEVSNGVLTLRLDLERSRIQPSQLTYRLTLMNLHELHVSGETGAEAATLATDRLSADVSGAGNLQIGQIRATGVEVSASGSSWVQVDHLEATSLGVEAHGESDVSIVGAADQQRTIARGASNCRLGDVSSREARVEAHGTSHAVVWVRERLDVHINGSGQVEYYGQPQVTQEMSGDGEVKGLGNKPQARSLSPLTMPRTRYAA